MNIEESIKILDKFTTEHKLFNIKHSDGLEEAIETLLTAYEKEKEKKYISKEKIKERIKEYYEYDKRMQNKPDWHTTKYYEAKALEKLLEE